MRWFFLPLLFICGSAIAQLPTIASGKIIRHENFPSQFITPRNVDVWLPDDYDPTKKYAVLYMHDGQMLFDSASTWNKQEWGIDEVVGQLLKEKKIRNCIVVGIWNIGKERHADYFPQKAFELLAKDQQDSIYTSKRLSGQAIFNGITIHSDNYLKFIVTELKPFIDQAYSTKTDRKNTFIAGSSMGGLISMYAICEYPDVFGGAACLSTHWPGIFTMENNPIPPVFISYLKSHLPDPRTHKIYFDYGDATLDAMYPPLQQQADEVMKQKGFTSKNWITKYFPGENHSENAWRKRLDQPLLFLLKR